MRPIVHEHPRDAQAADALLALGRLDDAKRVLLQALARQPESFELLGRLADVERRLGNWKEALRVAGLAAAADPESAWPHEIRAQTFMSRRKRKAAIAAAEEALRLDPDALAALEVLALQRRDLREARDAAQRMLDFDPELAAAHRAMAMVCDRARDHANAERHYREAVHLDPEDALYMMQLGHFLVRRGQRPEGAALMHFAAKLDPADERARALFHKTIPRVDDMELAHVCTILGIAIAVGLYFGGRKELTAAGVGAIILLGNLWDYLRRRSFRLTPEAEKFLHRIEEARR